MKGPRIQYVKKKFDNLYGGRRRGFIIGGGPSITKLQNNGFDFARLEGEITIGVNKAYNLLTPTYLFFGDTWFWKQFKDEIVDVECIKFCPDNVARKGKIDCTKHPDVYVINRDSGQGCHIRVVPESLDTRVSFWNNSGVSALRIAHVLGLKPLYLVGFDMYMQDEEGRTHFHNDYVGHRVAATSIVRYEQFYQAFEATIKALREKLVRIYSCSPVSKLNDLIPFKDLNDLTF